MAMKLNTLDSIESEILRTERDLPYVFVGRHQELRRLNNQFNVVTEQNQGSSSLVLVCGIPGIGKTQLIEKFARDKEHSGEALWLRLHPEDLTESKVLVLLRSALRRCRSSLRWTDVEVNVLGVKTNIARDQEFEELTTGLDQLVQSKHKQPIIVTVDEIQKLRPAQADVLSKFHTGFLDLPILVVCAGLQNSYAVLQQHGISRLGEMIELDLLSQEDCQDAIRRMLEIWGCSTDNLFDPKNEQRVRNLAQSAQGFPCHLQSHLSALKEVILEQGTSFDSEKIWLRVEEIAKQKRSTYYDERILALGFPNAGIVMHRIAKLLYERQDEKFKSISSSDVIKILNEIERVGKVDINKGKALHRLVESGCLKVEDYSFYSIPISSFQKHSLSKLDPYSESTS